MTRTKTIALSALGLAGFLIIWELVPGLGLVPATILPPPSALPGAFYSEIASGIWLSSLIRSTSHYLAGLLIGCVLGVSLGIITGLWVPLEATLAWVVRILRPIPGLAWVPFAILWFGTRHRQRSSSSPPACSGFRISRRSARCARSIAI